MPDPEIIEIIRRYLAALPGVGIHPSHALLFGSCARGQAHQRSDIDLLVVSPEFDDPLPIPIKLGLTIVNWWKRFGKGQTLDSLHQIESAVEPWSTTLVA